MASRTCERRTLPEEQAEPDETATPSRSNRISAVSARMPGIAKARVFGSRAASRPEHHRVDWIGGKTGLDCENKGLGTGGKPVAIAPGKLGRDAEADDPGDVLGAGPVAALLPAAADQAVADLDRVRGQHDRADALRAAELVRRQRQNIRPERLDVAGDFSGGLDRVGVQEPADSDAPAPPPRRPAGSRRSRCSPPGARPEPARRPPAPIARQARKGRQPPGRPREFSRRAPSRSGARRARRRARSRRRGGAMRPPSPTRRSDGVSTVFAASVPPLVKTTFLALAADQRRDLLPRPLDRAPGGAALGMHRGGIAGESKRARHRRRDLGPDRRRGIVVEIAARRAHRLPFTGESILAPDPRCRAKARSPHQRDAPGGAEFHPGPVQFRTILSRFGRHPPSSQGSRRSLCAYGARPAPVRG